MLKHQGLEALLTPQAMRPKGANLIRWKEDLHLSSFASSSAKYPETNYWDFHHADLHRCLMERRRELGWTVRVVLGLWDVRTSAEGEKSPATVMLVEGREMRTNLVVGADGVHSKMREILMGKPQPPTKALYTPPPTTSSQCDWVWLVLYAFASADFENMGWVWNARCFETRGKVNAVFV